MDFLSWRWFWRLADSSLPISRPSPQVRGDRFWKELDLVATRTLCLSAANAALVYLVAPTRAAPTPGRYEWQNMLAKLPNNAFEG